MNRTVGHAIILQYQGGCGTLATRLRCADLHAYKVGGLTSNEMLRRGDLRKAVVYLCIIFVLAINSLSA